MFKIKTDIFCWMLRKRILIQNVTRNKISINEMKGNNT